MEGNLAKQFSKCSELCGTNSTCTGLHTVLSLHSKYNNLIHFYTVPEHTSILATALNIISSRRKYYGFFVVFFFPYRNPEEGNEILKTSETG